MMGLYQDELRESLVRQTAILFTEAQEALKPLLGEDFKLTVLRGWGGETQPNEPVRELHVALKKEVSKFSPPWLEVKVNSHHKFSPSKLVLQVNLYAGSYNRVWQGPPRVFSVSETGCEYGIVPTLYDSPEAPR